MLQKIFRLQPLVLMLLFFYGCQKETSYSTLSGKNGNTSATMKAGDQMSLLITLPADCGQLRTQTPGGWGAVPKGNNPGVYLHSNFTAAFPDGLYIGCYPDNYYVKLTSAQAITDYLPAGGTPATLSANYTNPSTTALKNTLVSHLTALTLSVGFDNYDPAFGTAGTGLGSMIITSGGFANQPVSAFLEEANKVLGGCSTSYTIEQVLETASKINENYTDGKIDNGYLSCPE
ncbi:hypothetical protein [Agriterribacter humi]|uniref:hypothetical protein n=1 Tax=Agriterribacter humi TaxID=1104781 RepID=UPI001264B23D|nr:hypothetical protein [Agriterribacter humi]